MKIKFTQNACERLDMLAAYIYEQSRSKKVTAEYVKKVRVYIVEILTQFPKSGRPSDDLAPNTRKLVYQGFSIIYRIQEDSIEILTIFKENLP
jgi:plasmid stabilization system protein ParE